MSKFKIGVPVRCNIGLRDPYPSDPMGIMFMKPNMCNFTGQIVGFYYDNHIRVRNPETKEEWNFDPDWLVLDGEFLFKENIECAE